MTRNQPRFHSSRLIHCRLRWSPARLCLALSLLWHGPDLLPDTADDYTFPAQTTNVFGRYDFANLPPGQFQITIEDSSPTLVLWRRLWRVR